MEIQISGLRQQGEETMVKNLQTAGEWTMKEKLEEMRLVEKWENH